MPGRPKALRNSSPIGSSSFFRLLAMCSDCRTRNLLFNIANACSAVTEDSLRGANCDAFGQSSASMRGSGTVLKTNRYTLRLKFAGSSGSNPR